MSNDVIVSQLEEIFYQATTLAKRDRPSFLEDACGGDPGLRSMVERMLNADTKTSSLVGICNPGSISVTCPGQLIGRWRLKELIGSGGIGEVYHASCEADGVTLEAAVKILRPGFGDLLHDQFTQERLILAGIDHPFIARLIDAGVDSCGTSFMAMEFVEGLKLDQWLDQRNPNGRERLQLFNRICAAAGYLHENGIVHGDLKPSNVIVTPDGVPKLLDFGTARLITGSEWQGSTARWMVTPAYASPEQLAGLGPSPEGDVYSLGCILEEMLGAEAISSDLRALQDKCLARASKQRYASPQKIAEDVTRYLNHLPLRARSATPLYLSRKFLRRNRTVCVLASLVLLSLLLGWGISRHGLLRARQFAEQRHALVASLVHEDGDQQSPGTRQRNSYAAAVRDSIQQMERIEPPPFADLINAWRRLSYSQASRGQTPESINSIQRAIGWGRRYIQERNTDDARAQLAHSLLYAAAFHQRRGELRQAGLYALEAIQLADKLPGAALSTVEKAPEFVRAMKPAARMLVQSGDPEGARALLLRGLRLTRASSKSAQLRFILELVRLERAAKQMQRADVWCAQAVSLGIQIGRLHKLCGSAAVPDSEDALIKLAALHENRLVADPERYGDRLQMARLELRLARIAAQKGESVRAIERLERASQLAAKLLKEDPQNRNVQRLTRNIRLSSRRMPDL